MRTDEALIEYLRRNGYSCIRRLANGELAGLQKMLFTTGLFIGLDAYSWRTRFCYEHSDDAIAALASWDGRGFPPGFWIKQKPEETRNENPERIATPVSEEIQRMKREFASEQFQQIITAAMLADVEA